VVLTHQSSLALEVAIGVGCRAANTGMLYLRDGSEIATDVGCRIGDTGKRPTEAAGLALRRRSTLMNMGHVRSGYLCCGRRDAPFQSPGSGAPYASSPGQNSNLQSEMRAGNGGLSRPYRESLGCGRIQGDLNLQMAGAPDVV